MISILGWRVAFIVAVMIWSWAAAPVLAQVAPSPDDYAEAMRLIAAERYAEAAEVLARIVEIKPEHAGALLDLAIVQCTLGRPEAAARLLDAVSTRFEPPPAIRAVISQLRARGCVPAVVTANAWALSLGRGFDSNASLGTRTNSLIINGFDGLSIELPLSPDYLPQADHFSLLGAEFAQTVSGGGVRAFAQVQARVHDRLQRYDTAALLAGAEAPWQRGGWLGSTGVGVGVLRLGNQFYQRQLRARWQGAPPLSLPAGLRFSVLAELAYTGYPTLDNFDSVMGEVSGVLERHAGRTLLRASVAASADQATAERPGGDRKGWYAAVQARFPANGTIQSELAVSRRVWRGETAYAPGLIEQKRDQTTDSFAGSLVMPLTRQQAVIMELRMVRNRESIAVFNHDSRQLSIAWEWRG